MNKFFTCLCVWFFLILLVIRVLGAIKDELGVKCIEKERLALLKFKSELIDEYQRLSTWGIEEDKKECCTWKGVLCDDRTNHVVGLNLPGTQIDDLDLTPVDSYAYLIPVDFLGNASAPLRGNISSSLLELVDLQYLDLSANDFNRSPIPEFIGSLVKLQYLNLNSSNFGGWIPSRLGNLSMLRYLDVCGNSFLSGKDIDWVSNLLSLEYLDLSFVDLGKAKSWIQSIEKLTSLKAIYLKSCGLPETFHNSLPLINASASLAILDLSWNELTTFSIINRFLNFSSRFSYIDFSDNLLQGRIPNALGNMISLSHLNLCFNHLEGGIPIVLGNLTSLSYLDLSVNKLEGRIPGSFGNLISLAYLGLSDNKLEGRIPYDLGNLISLSHIDFSGNLLEGSIPHALGGLVSLSHLSLMRNQLQGEIPSSFKNLSNLRTIDLSSNSLNGQLSLMMKSLWNCTMLEILDLAENQIWGSLPIGSKFVVLRELRLSDNKLNGSFPRGSLEFPNLEVLDLSRNQIVGSVPDLSSCSSLRLLSLNDNMFNGNLNTQGIKHLSKLEIMDLGSNNLEGTINENHLFNKSQLRDLDLSLNSNLTVNIKSDWNPPFQLRTIKLASCTLGPNFPKWLQKQKNVVHLDISNANISDSIPKWFWDNSQTVDLLNMSFNQIYGTLPHFLSRSIQFLTIDLRSNNFSGSLPPFPKFLDYVDLSRNKFSGTVNYFCHIEWWRVLDLSNNVLSGELSEDCFKKMMTLEYLNLASNNFSGKIPSLFNMKCYLSLLHLRNNSFSGDFPTSLRNCYGLQMIDLGENNFTGMIPRWIGEKMSNLGVLSLKSNRFSGKLPSSFCQLANIQVLDISMNTISGTIPRCVNNLTSMRLKQGYDARFVFSSNTTFFYDKAKITWKGKEAEYAKELASLKAIDLSSNNFIGEIPVEITSLVGLFALNLSRNNLMGSIPRDIGLLELLNFLDLSQNNLSGSIPDTLSQLNHLGVLDLSFNNLSGRIPWITHMQTFSSSSYIGNPGLCGPPLLKPCPGDEIPNKKPMFNGNFDIVDQANDKFITTGFYISMAVGIIVGFWGVFGTLSLNNSWRTKLFKMLETLIDWVYVKLAVNRNRLQRYFQR